MDRHRTPSLFELNAPEVDRNSDARMPKVSRLMRVNRSKNLGTNSVDWHFKHALDHVFHCSPPRLASTQTAWRRAVGVSLPSPSSFARTFEASAPRRDQRPLRPQPLAVRGMAKRLDQFSTESVSLPRGAGLTSSPVYVTFQIRPANGLVAPAVCPQSVT